MFKVYGLLAFAGSFVAIVAAAYFYIHSLQVTVKELTRFKERAEGIIESQQKTIKLYGERIKLQSIAMNKLQEKMTQARKQEQKRNEVFNKHDIDRLAARKPKLISTYINRATERTFHELEEATK